MKRDTISLWLKNEKGFSLIEVLVSLVLMGMIGVGFLGAVTNASKASFSTDVLDSARSLAANQMEYVRKQAYADTYEPGPIPADYSGYSVTIDASPADTRDGNIQKVRVG
ncbi:MAG: prepilin-type N-terminal cleavage/methylation domain-containing protein, partial [Dehalococcoidales bacterium]|nr:prepilin-type N-terminal cleavage/methylation domain-containing protein [Dehalococcoidales bacterium]